VRLGGRGTAGDILHFSLGANAVQEINHLGLALRFPHLPTKEEPQS